MELDEALSRLTIDPQTRFSAAQKRQFTNYSQQLRFLVRRKSDKLHPILQHLAKSNPDLAPIIATQYDAYSTTLSNTYFHEIMKLQPDEEDECIDCFWPEGVQYGLPVAVRIKNVRNKSQKAFDDACMVAFHVKELGLVITECHTIQPVPEAQAFFERYRSTSGGVAPAPASQLAIRDAYDYDSEQDEQEDKPDRVDAMMMEVDDDERRLELEKYEQDSWKTVLKGVYEKRRPIWQIKVVAVGEAERVRAIDKRMKSVALRGNQQ